MHFPKSLFSEICAEDGRLSLETGQLLYKQVEDLQEEIEELKQKNNEAITLLQTICPDHYVRRNEEPFITIERAIELLKSVIQNENTNTFENDTILQEDRSSGQLSGPDRLKIENKEDPAMDTLEEDSHISKVETCKIKSDVDAKSSTRIVDNFHEVRVTRCGYFQDQMTIFFDYF